jgi:glucose dehydrogenase
LNGFVFIGNAGGDSKGVKGRMYALNARTGEIIWEFYLLPKSVDDQARGPQRATWTSYTLDPVTGELFVSGGNPGPGLATGLREGANLYSGSVIALNTRTGICTASTSAPIHCGIVYR